MIVLVLTFTLQVIRSTITSSESITFKSQQIPRNNIESNNKIDDMNIWTEMYKIHEGFINAPYKRENDLPDYIEIEMSKIHGDLPNKSNKHEHSDASPDFIEIEMSRIHGDSSNSPNK